MTLLRKNAYARFVVRSVMTGLAAFFAAWAANPDGDILTRTAVAAALSAGVNALIGLLTPWEPNVGVKYETDAP